MKDIVSIAEESCNVGDIIYFLNDFVKPDMREIVSVEIKQYDKSYSILYKVKDSFPDENHRQINSGKAFSTKQELIKYISDEINNIK